MKRVLSIVLICVLLLGITSCGNRKETHTSPNGENKITIEYDFVSRPKVKYKGSYIWSYPGRGFNEEVFFDVEWVDEETFKLIYRDARHNGKYYEEFEIDL